MDWGKYLLVRENIPEQLEEKLNRWLYMPTIEKWQEERVSYTRKETSKKRYK